VYKDRPKNTTSRVDMINSSTGGSTSYRLRMEPSNLGIMGTL